MTEQQTKKHKTTLETGYGMDNAPQAPDQNIQTTLETGYGIEDDAPEVT